MDRTHTRFGINLIKYQRLIAFRLRPAVEGGMSYPIRFSLFMLAAGIVAGALGYFSAFFGPWAVLFGLLLTIPLTIEIARRVLKQDRL
jgi:hypothetical protein